ncbi:MAG TPA: ScyD/ScyE family protein [Thermomicrobiales bacterium]|nr:ScyD/ScyE family protein [Thermomicrobiales bacterium]
MGTTYGFLLTAPQAPSTYERRCCSAPETPGSPDYVEDILAMRFVHLTSLIVMLVLTTVANPVSAQNATPVAAGTTTVASGLTNPRGFTWGPDGALYLALAGTGGETPGTIEGAEDGIYGGPTSSVVKIEDGNAVPVIEGLPSGNWRDAGWIWGAHDVAFLDDQLYILSAGGGIDFGNPDEPTALLRVEADGSTTMVADIGTWSAENLPAFVPPDFNPSGSFFDMEVGTDRIWLSEAVGGRIITVTPDGTIALVADIFDGHLVPTGMALAPDGGVYVGFLTAIPYTDGTAKVIHVAEDGTVTDFWTGLTAVSDLEIGPDGMLYAVELATGNTMEPPFLTPNSGRIVRMTGPDSLEPVVTGLDAPAYIGFGPDGALYLTTPSYAPDAGAGHGELLRVELPAALSDSPSSLAYAPSCAYSGNGC